MADPTKAKGILTQSVAKGQLIPKPAWNLPSFLIEGCQQVHFARFANKLV